MSTQDLSFYQKKRVAITGGASFIGSHLAGLLLEQGANVVISDDLSTGSRENIKNISSQIEFIEGNLCEPAVAREALAGAEILFHLAAAHGGRGYIDTHPVACVGNMSLDYQVFSAASRAGIKKTVFASSGCVYPVCLQASKAGVPLSEDQAGFAEPGQAFADGEYGWSKLMGEFQLRAFHKQFQASGISSRLFTVYGERENESHVVAAMVAKTLLRLDPFPIWGDGSQTRDFIFIQDAVNGMALAGAKLDGCVSVNISTGFHTSILDLLEVIFAISGWRPRTIRNELNKPVGVVMRAGDPSKASRLLGWRPAHSLTQGLERTISWYENSVSRELLEKISATQAERLPQIAEAITAQH